MTSFLASNLQLVIYVTRQTLDLTSLRGVVGYRAGLILHDPAQLGYPEVTSSILVGGIFCF